MNGLPETIADFIALRRANANALEIIAGGKPNQFQRELIADLRDEADRLEAAWKSERATVGNTAKMREAVEACLFYLERIDHGMNDYMRGLFDTAYKKAKDALTEPARNCDGFGGDPKRLHDEWWKWSGDPRNCNEDGTVKMTYGEWLLEKAKGEKDGSK